ncbi:MAG: histidinol-phosphatase HisJ family protein [Ruminococcaceae bacterium]|nr:histidinol-phosphatase HisJ family protein [Oscillospiraceae bacterium]
MRPANYHTHTCFCDGVHAPGELVAEAIRLGCPELGFSGHSYTAFDSSFCMSPEGTREYIAAVRGLQESCREKICIRLGVEQDYYSDAPVDGYDYVIGSVHYVKKDGCYLSVDESRESQTEYVRRFYHGDYYGFIEDYYKNLADLYRKTRCQIIGHFDLVKKFNGPGDLFDPQHPRYRAAVDLALEALLQAPVRMEVNMGAIARGYLTEPYPARDILTRWLAAGKEVLFSSDCHHAQQLLFGYDLYEDFVRSCREA